MTAQKRAENIQRVPMSITALSGAVLAARGVTDILELPMVTPNLRLDTVSQTAGVSLRIRGIGASSNAAIDPSVAPYLDGVFIPRPGAILTSFLDVDDVEVLRGPQGTLFGRNATVGAIVLRTRAPSLTRDSAELSAEVGGYGARKVQGLANFTTGHDTALRIAAFASHDDGWIRDLTDGTTHGGSSTHAARLSFRADPTPQFDWVIRVDYAHSDGDAFHLTQVDVATATPAQLARYSLRSTTPLSLLTGPGFDTVQHFDHPSLNDWQWGVTSNAAWRIAGGYTLRLIDAFRSWRDTQTDGDVVFTPLDLLNRHGAFASDSQSHELQVLSPQGALLGGRLDFVSGLYYFDERYATSEVLDLGSQFCGFVYGANPAALAGCSAGPQASATVGRFEQRADSAAAYGQANLAIAPSLTLAVGARYTRDRKSGAFEQAVSNPFVGAGVLRAPEATALSLMDDHADWLANVSWRITPDVMTFVSFATGYKSGGFNNAGGAAPLDAATRTFKSETSTDVELGLKSTFFDRHLRLNADLYQTDLSDFQDRSFNGITFIIRNAGDVRARGAEAEGQFLPSDRVRLDFGLAYLDSIFTQNTSAPGLPGCTGAAGSCPLVQNLTGRPTTFAPKWQVDLNLEYDTKPFGGGWIAEVRGSMSYASRAFTTNDDNPQSLTGGETLLGARLDLHSPDRRWRAGLWCENLTNVKYFTLKFPQTLGGLFGGLDTATGAALMRGFMGAPFTFGGSVAATF